ncbi:MAG: hypothetical protein KDC67_13370 [Ignavibacteriae bacterium]|nr:hypothetical protein [Ignavibacteriota bacterium]
MSTYREMAEIVRRRLAGGDISADFSIEPEEIYVRIAQISPYLLRGDFWENYRMDPANTMDATYYTTITSKPIHDKELDEYYVVLPGKPVMISGRGAPQVWYPHDRTWPFYYMEGGQGEMLAAAGITLEVGNSTNFWLETVSEDCLDSVRLYFDKLEDCLKLLKVKLVQIADINCINPDAPIGLPGHLEEPLILSLVNWFTEQDQTIEDSVPDNKNIPL